MRDIDEVEAERLTAEAREKLTKQICYRISLEVYDLIEGLCYTELEIAGESKRLKVVDISKYAREFMLRGMVSFFEEKQMVEKAKKIMEAEAKLHG